MFITTLHPLRETESFPDSHSHWLKMENEDMKVWYGKESSVLDYSIIFYNTFGPWLPRLCRLIICSHLSQSYSIELASAVYFEEKKSIQHGRDICRGLRLVFFSTMYNICYKFCCFPILTFPPFLYDPKWCNISELKQTNGRLFNMKRNNNRQ